MLAIYLTSTRALVLVALAAGAALCAIWWIPKRQARRWSDEGIRGKELADLENGARGTVVQIVGGVALILTFAATWMQISDARRAAANARRASVATLKLTQEQQETERFTEAMKELGSGALVSHLGGLYALDRIAGEDVARRRSIEQILIAWLPRSHAVSCLASRPAPADTQSAFDVIVSYARSLRKGEAVDLSGTDLRGVNLDRKRRDLKQFNFDHAQLGGARLDDAILDGARLDYACLQAADFSGAEMVGTRLTNSHLSQALFYGANLAQADLTGADARDTQFDRATLNGTKPPNPGQMRGASAFGADLRFDPSAASERDIRRLLAGVNVMCARLPWRPRRSKACVQELKTTKQHR